MIRQIVLEPVNAAARETVGLLLTSADLEEFEIRSLGERLARAGESVKGHVGGVRYRFEVLEDVVPGLEYVTVRLPAAGPTRQEILELDHQGDGDNESLPTWVEETLEEMAMRDRVLMKRSAVGPSWPTGDPAPPGKQPCDRVPRWLWPLVAVVGLGLIVAGVR